MNNLIVSTVEIRQDSEGRYNLADLHKSAGGKHKDQPNYWLRSEKTEELIKSLIPQKRGIKPVEAKTGRYGGTYVCEELVYDYAMWISAEFKLKVIRAFNTLQKEGVAVADHAADDFLDDPLKYFDNLLSQAKKLKAERDRFALERDAVVDTIGKHDHSLTRVARMISSLNTTAIKRDLCKLGYLYRRTNNGTYRVYSKYLGKFFIEKFDENTGKGDIFCTPEGKKLIATLAKEGKLTMKASAK